MRLLFIGLLLASAGVTSGEDAPPAETTAPTAEQEPTPEQAQGRDHHVFTAGEIRRYLAETKQQVKWTSAGETLDFTTSISMEFSCYVDAIHDDGSVSLVWRVLDLRARHRGPDATFAIDTSQDQGQDDPLLGDLFIYHLIPLALRVDPHSGEVLEFSGEQALIDALNERHPSANPVAPPPRDAAARKAYDPLQLARLFGRYLAVPGSSETLDLGPALSGSAQIRWDGPRYQLFLPKDSEAPRLELHSDPTPVTLHLRELNGEGQTTIDAEGLLQRVSGSYSLMVEGQALTQGVEQEHQVDWQMVLLSRGQSKRAPDEEETEQP